MNEPLPEHSSLTKIRRRYGIEVFRRFFDKMVDQCQEAGLVWGKELYIDSTKVEANASVDSVKPRFLSMRISPICSLPKQRKGEQRQCRR